MYDVVVTPDLIYRQVDGESLMADLHRPETETPPPVAVYVHGGGFKFGSRSDHADTRLSGLARHGIAVLSVDYRLAPASRFPAPLHDIRAAVQWVRANASTLGVDATRVAIWGASAGGLLASLVALTSDDAELDETVGSPTEQSGAVQAVVAWFPLTDLLADASRSALETAAIPFDFESAFFGADSLAEVIANPDLANIARRASPVNWASATAPPFLIAHGDRDRFVMVGQSITFHDALVRAGANSSLMLVGGAGHQDAAFDAPANLALTAAWITTTLAG
jgi:acetyl esterase/lipase